MNNIPVSQLIPIAAAWQSALNSLNAVISAAQTSAPGTTVTAPSTETLTDATGSIWGFGTATVAGGTSIQRNGAGVGGGVEIEIDVNGVVWAINNASQWYTWNGSNWTGPTATGPTI
jgi:hypothetical protein